MSTDAAYDTVLDRLPTEVFESLTAEQRAALWQAAKPMTWRRHPVNLRLTIPVPFSHQRYFVTVVGGMDKRGKDRLSRERRMFPLRTVGNMLFLLGLGGAFYIAAAIGLLLLSQVVSP
jgi:hypothetical protein